MSRKQNKEQYLDRFIPRRSEIDLDTSNHFLMQSSDSSSHRSNTSYISELARATLMGGNVLQTRRTSTENRNSVSRKQQDFKPVCERELDAPDTTSDFYHNVLDWSSQDVIAIVLGEEVYTLRSLDVYNGINHFPMRQSRRCSSLKFDSSGRYLALGTVRDGDIYIYDMTMESLVRRTIKGNGRGRISGMSWNGLTLSTGGKSGNVETFDLRLSSPNPVVCTYYPDPDDGGICGLKWDHSLTYIGYGTNEGVTCVLDSRNNEAILHDKSSAAGIKAISWNPHMSHTLVTGGGTMDRRICVWDVSRGVMTNEKYTGSQVCSVVWSKICPNTIISAHGFVDNELNIWNYPDMLNPVTLLGHTDRALQMVESPCGQLVASASPDETLKIWRVFPSGEQKKPENKMNFCSIR